MGGGQNPAPVKLVYKLDGTESKNMVMGRGGAPTRAGLQGDVGWPDKLVITTTTPNGETRRGRVARGRQADVETREPGPRGRPGDDDEGCTYKKAR